MEIIRPPYLKFVAYNLNNLNRCTLHILLFAQSYQFICCPESSLTVCPISTYLYILYLLVLLEARVLFELVNSAPKGVFISLFRVQNRDYCYSLNLCHYSMSNEPHHVELNLTSLLLLTYFIRC